MELIDKKTSKWLKITLNKDDKRNIAIKNDRSISYIDMIINRDRYNKSIVSDLIKKAKKKELKA